MYIRYKLLKKFFCTISLAQYIRACAFKFYFVITTINKWIINILYIEIYKTFIFYWLIVDHDDICKQILQN